MRNERFLLSIIAVLVAMNLTRLNKPVLMEIQVDQEKVFRLAPLQNAIKVSYSTIEERTHTIRIVKANASQPVYTTAIWSRDVDNIPNTTTTTRRIANGEGAATTTTTTSSVAKGVMSVDSTAPAIATNQSIPAHTDGTNNGGYPIRDPNRRTFVFFVGPPKTATTSHQVTFGTLTTTLYEDGYDYLGIYAKHTVPPKTRSISNNQLIGCLNDKFDSSIKKQPEPSCWGELKTTFDSLHKQRMDALLSLEPMAMWFQAWAGREKLRLLCQELLPEWRVEFVITYRRLLEHFVSIHFELNQNRNDWHPLNVWPSGDSDKRNRRRRQMAPTIQPIPDMVKRESTRTPPFDPSHSIRVRKQSLPGSYTTYLEVHQMIQEFKITNAVVQTISLHDEDFQETILCSYLQAPKACLEYKSSKTANDAQQNPTISLAYDMIAMEIFNRRWIANTDRFSRTAARSSIARLLLKEQVTSPNEQLPTICPEDWRIRRLANVSWEVEQMMLSERASLEDHERAYDKAISAHKFCSVDAAAVVDKYADVLKPFVQKASAK